ncbi:MAG TPA: MerR family transcriptional regulator [Xanthobacteraceae bacterium]|nr:MerR family transcriptional regulator [Xanthobacteraceae bacterium]
MATLEKAPDAFRTISEVAQDLDVPQHVLRFWESRFRDIKPMKRGGGRRYYRPDDVHLLRGIRHLLYGEGYTIKGVQRILREQGVKFVQTVWQPGAPQLKPQAPEEDADVVAEEADRGAAPVAEVVERGRGLLALLPALLGDEDNDAGLPSVGPRTEPVLAAVERKSGRALAVREIGPPSLERLARGELRKLQAALHDLGECRKLLAAALNGPA